MLTEPINSRMVDSEAIVGDRKPDTKLSQNRGSLHGFENRWGEPRSETVKLRHCLNSSSVGPLLISGKGHCRGCNAHPSVMLP